MIIILDKNKEKVILFPKNIYTENRENESEYDYKLILTNRGTNKEYEFNVNDERMINFGFYSFKLDFSDVPEDEYEYSIYVESEVVGSGIIRLNSLDDKQSEINLEYNENRTYIAYDKQ